MSEVKKKVVFLFGGPGAEHDVSVATAMSALPAFADTYQLLPVYVTAERKWVVADDFVAPQAAWVRAEAQMQEVGLPADIALEQIEKQEPDVVFIGLHGEYGEDGTVQALLEARGLAFTGSDSEASALAMDKPQVLQLLQNEDILVPDFLEVTSATSEQDINSFCDYVGYPVVVLPADRGSSAGISLVHASGEIGDALALARKVSSRVMLSKHIAGRDASCGVLVTGHNELTVLPPTEIRLKGQPLWDYEAKYTKDACEEITPATFPNETIGRIQSLAKRVHHLVRADGFSRADMIVQEDGSVVVLEINTLPGLTPTSVLPAEAQAHGLTFTELLTAMCEHVDRSGTDYITAA